jgi:hypothetical protein
MRRDRVPFDLTMNTLITLVALFLLANIAAGLLRVALGPTPADRMLVAQLLGTTGRGPGPGPAGSHGDGGLRAAGMGA